MTFMGLQASAQVEQPRYMGSESETICSDRLCLLPCSTHHTQKISVALGGMSLYRGRA